MWAITLPTRINKAFKSIRFKFILAYLLILLFAFAAIGVSAMQPVGEHMFKRAGETALERLRFAKMDADKAMAAEDYAGLNSLCQNLDETFGARSVVLDEKQNVVVDARGLLNGQRLTFASIDLSLVSRDGIYKNLKRSEAEHLAKNLPDTRVSLAAVRLENGEMLIAVFGADYVLRDLKSLAAKLTIVACAVLVLSVVLGFIITRSYTRPVKDLSEAIGQLSSGDFSVRVKEEGNNEFTDLSRAFNEMTGRMEMLDRSRNQFVSNASHELKTPLATIKIMVQTLLYQEVYDESMSKEFLGDVDKEVDRLSAVVSDLLTLVGMDSGESKLNMEEFSLSDMIKEDVKRLSPLARERGIEMELSVAAQIDVCGDRIKLDQVFYNLIDNAIKYTPRGEGIRVELVRQNKNAVVRVKDNGIGIPESDLKHIFDRFYRVDKARSRETGGTGLGLSIAKQIILAHGGTINVTSKLDEGSTFTVHLPISAKQTGRQGA